MGLDDKNFGFVSQALAAGRIVSGGKVNELPFKPEKGALFSIYVRPKAATNEIDAIVSVQLYQQSNPVEMPVVLNDWSPLVIKEIPAGGISLIEFDVYWGAGSKSE